jgi:hypothetical protein
MKKEGKYLYCIIGGNDGRNFGPIGIGGRGDIVSTLGHDDISAALSSSPMERYVINRDNLTAHENVIEEVMKDYTVLPVRFCTIAATAEDVRTLLCRRYREFKGLLRDMDNKVEMGLKAVWKEMSQIYSQIEQTPDVRSLKKRISASKGTENQGLKIALGKAVKTSLDARKEKETRRILQAFRRLAIDMRANEGYGDRMFLNAAFLIDRTREKQFDFMVEDLVKQYGDTADFKYVGPAPPFNFINIEVKW